MPFGSVVAFTVVGANTNDAGAFYLAIRCSQLVMAGTEMDLLLQAPSSQWMS